jgi:hypothetical protein
VAPDRTWVLQCDPGLCRACLLPSGSPVGVPGHAGERWNLKAPVERLEGELSRVLLTHRRSRRA